MIDAMGIQPLCSYGFRHVIAALLGCIFMLSCSNTDKEVKAIYEKKTSVDEARNVESYMSQGGKMKAKLTAPLMLRYQDTLPRVEFTETLHVDFYDDSVRIESQLDAHYARYLETQNRIFLRDSVRVFNKQGDTLFCQELWWDQPELRFHTDKPVRIHRPGTIINGVGLTAPQDFKTFTIFKITNSVLRVNQGLESMDTSPAQSDSTSVSGDSTVRRFQRPSANGNN
jgi:LPS export ABC transporter protein LptC